MGIIEIYVDCDQLSYISYGHIQMIEIDWSYRDADGSQRVSSHV